MIPPPPQRQGRAKKDGESKGIWGMSMSLPKRSLAEPSSSASRSGGEGNSSARKLTRKPSNSSEASSTSPCTPTSVSGGTTSSSAAAELAREDVPSSPASTAFSSLACDQRVWLVELARGGSAEAERSNRETLGMAIADAKGENGVVIKLCHVITAIPCALGGELAVSKVDKKVIKNFEVQIFQSTVQSQVLFAKSKKLDVKYVPARADRREEGIKEVAHKVQAERFYTGAKMSNAKLLDALELTMPGGCTIVAVSGSKKVREYQVEQVEVLEEGDTSGQLEGELLSKRASTWGNSSSSLPKDNKSLRGSQSLSVSQFSFLAPGSEPPMGEPPLHSAEGLPQSHSDSLSAPPARIEALAKSSSQGSNLPPRSSLREAQARRLSGTHLSPVQSPEVLPSTSSPDLRSTAGMAVPGSGHSGPLDMETDPTDSMGGAFHRLLLSPGRAPGAHAAGSSAALPLDPSTAGDHTPFRRPPRPHRCSHEGHSSPNLGSPESAQTEAYKYCSNSTRFSARQGTAHRSADDSLLTLPLPDTSDVLLRTVPASPSAQVLGSGSGAEQVPVFDGESQPRGGLAGANGAAPVTHSIATVGAIAFSISQVFATTGSFSPKQLINLLPAGSLYGGMIDGCQVAVVQLTQWAWKEPQAFLDAVCQLASRAHPNVAFLMGSCAETKTLIYGNLKGRGTLFQHLKGVEQGSGVGQGSSAALFPPLSLPWRQRVSILSQVSEALAWLHSREPLRHTAGVLCPEAILLDSALNCQVCLAGVAELAEDQNMASDWLFQNWYSEAKGTSEVVTETHGSPKQRDAFAFGLLILQVLTGTAERSEVLLLLKHSASPPEPCKEGIGNGVLDGSKAPSIEQAQLLQLYAVSRASSQDITWPQGVLIPLVHLVLKCTAGNPGDRPSMWEATAQLFKALSTAAAEA